MCCTRLAGNTGRKKSSFWHHCSNIYPTCPYNMVNFGPLAAEIISLVWSTPGNFNGFCVLAALLHGTLVVVVSQTAALNRGRHLYSVGRPSRWALAHISSCLLSYLLHCCLLNVMQQCDDTKFFFVLADFGVEDFTSSSIFLGTSHLSSSPTSLCSNHSVQDDPTYNKNMFVSVIPMHAVLDELTYL